MAFSVHTRVDLMTKALSGAPAKEMEKAYEEHNRCYSRFFHYFYDSIYKDKYYAMGDYDTMTTAFLLDTGLYYAAAIMPVYRWSHDRLGFPPYYQDGAEIGYYPIRFYNRRLAAIAKRKMALGIYGNHNAGRRPGFVGYSVRSAFLVMIAHGLLRWEKPSWPTPGLTSSSPGQPRFLAPKGCWSLRKQILRFAQDDRASSGAMEEAHEGGDSESPGPVQQQRSDD